MPQNQTRLAYLQDADQPATPPLWPDQPVVKAVLCQGCSHGSTSILLQLEPLITEMFRQGFTELA